VEGDRGETESGHGWPTVGGGTNKRLVVALFSRPRSPNLYTTIPHVPDTSFDLVVSFVSTLHLKCGECCCPPLSRGRPCRR
jgi:hypothetical protein